jgi:hypothetical protein
MQTSSDLLDRAIDYAKIDLSPPHRQPSGIRVVVASLAAIIGSLVADAIIVAVTTSLYPATKGFAHFRFSDYAKLTVVGVVIACVAWPIVTRLCAAPRWLFFRLAIVVTAVLFLPDLYLLLKGQSATAVAALMVMHVAIALITYNLLVHLAPVGEPRRRRS